MEFYDESYINHFIKVHICNQESEDEENAAAPTSPPDELTGQCSPVVIVTKMFFLSLKPFLKCKMHNMKCQLQLSRQPRSHPLSSSVLSFICFVCLASKS